ncbi:MAG: outer membrane beta-barrel protein [Ignavibacteriaceae bacterium]|nr:outer membrane beta-barrel protein [Ignavibacteriaceae bacterium]
MKNRIVTFSVFLLLIFSGANMSFAQDVLLGPRISGNLNIFNQQASSNFSFSGIGVGIGGTLDITFSKHIGLMVDLTAFDMRNVSASNTANNATTDVSLTLSYLTIDPMFALNFSGFYMVAGPSLGIKLGSSASETQTPANGNPTVTTYTIKTNSIVFDIATGVGYTFKLSPDMFMGTDFMVYIPLSNTYDLPGNSNSVLTLKLGVSLKFNIM